MSIHSSREAIFKFGANHGLSQPLKFYSLCKVIVLDTDIAMAMRAREWRQVAPSSYKKMYFCIWLSLETQNVGCHLGAVGGDTAHMVRTVL